MTARYALITGEQTVVVQWGVMREGHVMHAFPNTEAGARRLAYEVHADVVRWLEITTPPEVVK